MIATANTKGKGSEDGRFIGTNVLNEAFLERFALTFEQAYPTPATEQKILVKLLKSLSTSDVDHNDEEFCEKLTQWSDAIRKAFDAGADGIDEIISTRRLVHIIRAFTIFGTRQKAIETCINRFDEETKEKLFKFYKMIDPSIEK